MKRPRTRQAKPPRTKSRRGAGKSLLGQPSAPERQRRTKAKPFLLSIPRKTLRRACSALDDVELDSAFAAALRGDNKTLKERLARGVLRQQSGISPRVKHSWNDTEWIFGRK
jgi:hypothetical protein